MVEPERELVRRILPLALPAAAVAFVAGLAIGDLDAGWSALLGVAVIAANFAAHGLSLAWAARISPTVLFAVALGGFVVRLGVILAILAALDTLPWFSPVAFVAAVVPATVLLLGYELKMLSGRMQADLWSFPAGGPGIR